MYGNTEMPAMKEDIYIHRSLKAGNTPWHAGPYGEGSGVREGVRRERMTQSLYWGFHRKDCRRQGSYGE